MGKNKKSKEADNTATITTTNKSTSRIVTCRCCLSEAEDEVTDFLPLDAVATISVRCENDGAANGVGESSSCVSATAAATLLDCLNGCARIGATLEDATLPLHICIDCSQALEACCEFIRCVQNADQILRSKRRKTIKIAQMANSSKNIEVVDPVIVAAAETSNLDENNLVSVASNEQQLVKHTKLLPIGSLNLMDVNVNNNCQMTPTLSCNTILQKTNVHQTISKKVCPASSFTTNASSIRPLEPNIDQNSFRSSNLPLNAITRIDFDFLNASKSSKVMQDLHSETVNATNLSNGEATHFINLNTLSNKDCEALELSAHTVQIIKQNDILNTHKFIPPFDKDNNTNRDEQVSKKLPIINIDFRLKSIQCDGKCDATPVNDINSVKYSTLECDERKYIVNAALVKDLVKFHLENKGKQKYICMFCKFMCNNKQMWDQHLAVHLGAPRYKCSQCNFECRFKYYMTQHLKKVHRMLTTEMQLKPKLEDVSISWTKHYCGLCRSYFTSFIALQQHHHIGEEPYFKCTHCQVSETKRENLMEHLAMEHKVFIDAQFIVAYIPNSLNPTIKTDETDVNKIFLNQFIRFHPKEPKFTVHLCQYCGKSFQRRFHLLKHEHYVHPNDNTTENEKYFKRRTTKYARQQYMRHLRATQAEHQFKCDICHGVFKTLAERSAHVHQQHSTYFQCVTCEATFVFEFELKYHMRTHSTRTSSTLASPRYDHPIETSNSISKELKDRLYQLGQQKQNKKIASSNSMRKRSRPITKRRLSLASVSTTKSSESSVNSPSNTNSDEDMPSIGSDSSKIITTLNPSDINIAPISVADVMLPQPTQRAITMRRLSTTSIVSLSKFCATNYTSSTLPQTLSQEPLCTSSERNFNCDFGEQPYLTDFDLNLLDCSNDFLLDFSSL